jgi:hypothetical protein
MLKDNCDVFVSARIGLGRIFFLAWDKMTQRHGFFALK